MHKRFEIDIIYPTRCHIRLSSNFNIKIAVNMFDSIVFNRAIYLFLCELLCIPLVIYSNTSNSLTKEISISSLKLNRENNLIL